MITGIFCHDLPIYKDINGIYCSTTMTDDLFSRYFKVVDRLIVATRIFSIDCTYEEAHQEKITLPNIEYIEFPNLNKPQYVFSRIPKAMARLEEIMKEVDLIFIRGGIIGMLGAKVALKLKKTYLIEVAGCSWDEYWNHSISGKIIAPYMEISTKRNVRNAQFAVYVTEKWLQTKYPTDGVCSYASNVILTSLSDDSLKRRISKISNRKKNDTWVLGTTAGINNKAKGQQYVIEAISKIRNQNIRYELVGSGDNSYLKSIAKKYGVQDKIIFKGELSHEEVLSWLDSIDTYIQPSMQEGLPRALIEAMSRGCPSIGSTTGGIPELLEKDSIFSRGSVKDLIQTMMRFYESNWIEHATINFNKAKEYQIDILNERRNAIYEKYKEFVLAENTHLNI